jgi:hypothetical protein
MDNLQGKSRLERHENYLEMLQMVGLDEAEHYTVPGVGHDHSLMFQSEEGIRALFGSSLARCSNMGEISSVSL